MQKYATRPQFLTNIREKFILAMQICNPSAVVTPFLRVVNDTWWRELAS